VVGDGDALVGVVAAEHIHLQRAVFGDSTIEF
jgi:hypothetical protein